MISTLTDFAKVMSMPCKEHAAIISRLTGDLPVVGLEAGETSPLSKGTRAGLWLHERYCTGCKAYHLQLTTLHKGILTLATTEDPQFFSMILAKTAADPASNGHARFRGSDGCPPEVLDRVIRSLHAG